MQLQSLKNEKFKVLKKDQLQLITGGDRWDHTTMPRLDIAGAPDGHEDWVYVNDLNQSVCAEVLDRNGKVIWTVRWQDS